MTSGFVSPGRVPLVQSVVTMLRIALFVAAATVACGGGNAPLPTLATTAERSGYTRTGRFDEVERLCAAFQQAWPTATACG